MKRNLSLQSFRKFGRALECGLLVLATATVHGANGTWTNDVNAPDTFWSAATNWLNGAIADGAGSTATFSNELAAIVTVNLDTPRTIGNLDFQLGTYSITNNGADDVNVLTLANGANQPVISVPVATTATIQRTVLAGSSGFALDGGGTLNLFKDNSDSNHVFTSGIVISNGTIQVGGGIAGNDIFANNLVLGGVGDITFVNGTLNVRPAANTSPDYGVVNNNLIVPAGATGTIVLPLRFSGAVGDNSAGIGQGLGGTLTGAGTLNVDVRYLRGNVVGDWSAFTGQINIVPGGTQADNEFRFGNPAGFPNASVDLGGTSPLPFNYFRALTADTTISVGSLSGANPQATLPGSDTAGFTLTFDIGAKQTSVTDLATFAGSLVDGAGPAALLKRGAGTLVLSGDNTHSGGTTISNGVLQIGDGFSLTGSLGSGPVANWGTLVIARLGSLAVPGDISGTGGLTNATLDDGLTGNAVSLLGANTYTGPTAITSGKLAVGSGSMLPGNVTVSDTAILGALVTSAGSSVTHGSMVFGTGCSFDFDLANFGNPSGAVVTNTGNITLNGNVTVNVSGSVFAPGTITLLRYASRSGAGSFVQGTLPPEITSATFLDDQANNRVILTINSVAVDPTLRWVGDATGNWDIANAANQVWRAVASGQLTNYSDGLPVRFDDSATGATTVNVTTLVAPGGVTVNNSTLSYKLVGTGAVSGTNGLTKLGSNKLTIATYLPGSDYTGPTVIGGGTLEIGDGTNPGSMGNGAVTNNGRLLLNSTLDVTVAGSISGTGVVAQVGSANAILTGVNTHSGGLEINPGTVLTLQSPGTPGGAGATVRINDGTLSIVNINVPGGNPVVISNSAVIASTTGNRQVDAPVFGTNVTLTFSNSTLLTLNGSLAGVSGTIVCGTPAGQLLRFNSGGANNCFGSSNALFVIPAGASIQNRNGGNIDLGGLEGAGILGGPQNANNQTVNFRIGALNTDTVYIGTIDNGDLTQNRNRLTGITKVGTGSLTLSNAILPYFGPTIVSNGVLAFAGSGAPANTVNLTIAAPGILNVAGLDAGMLSLGVSPANSNGVQILRGDGILQGNVSFGSAGRLEPGFSIGTLTVSGSATLGGTNLFEISGTTSDQLKANSITYGGTLIVTNIGGPISGTNTYQLFDGAVSGMFTSVVLPTPPAGGSWDTSGLAANGSIKSLFPSAVDQNPTNITATLTGNILNLSWPASHVGWRLQVQTNALNVGISTNWVEVTDSAATNQVSVAVDPANGSVYYRMVYP